jgi:hypothetical protein
MSLRSTLVVLATLVSASAFAAGCAVDTTSEQDGEEVESSSEAELSAAGRALIGSYIDDSGTFRSLVLTHVADGSRNRFFADVVVNGQPVRMEGTFSAGPKTVTLRSATPVAGNPAKALFGQYKYLVQGDKLSLTRSGTTQSLEKVGSYCKAATDCAGQGIIHPMCVGSYTCSANNACGWKCGVPVPVDPCAGKTQAACTADSACQPVFGPSSCNGNRCTRDFVFKSCKVAPAAPSCMSSASCGAGEHCSTEDGVCNSSGMLAVCSGTCVADVKCMSSASCTGGKHCSTEDGVCNSSGMLAVCSGTCVD